MPYSKNLERSALPNEEKIMNAVRCVIGRECHDLRRRMLEEARQTREELEEEEEAEEEEVREKKDLGYRIKDLGIRGGNTDGARFITAHI
jgi:hypothetical protein